MQPVLISINISIDISIDISNDLHTLQLPALMDSHFQQVSAIGKW